MSKSKIVVIYGGPSTEHDVSIWSAAMVVKNIDRNKFDVTEVKIHKNGSWQFLPGKKIFDLGDAVKILEQKKFDLAFLALHGYFGEDGHIQAILETIQLKYTGSGMTASAVAMDKTLSNALYKTKSFNVPNFYELDLSSPYSKPIKFPAVIKPVAGGSTVGTYIVKNLREFKKQIKETKKVSNRIMVQDYIKGREFTCGVLEKNGVPIPLMPTEIITKSKFFDFKAKYTVGGSSEITPPDLPTKQIKELQRQAVQAHKLLGCRGMSRSDFILKAEKFYILETNTIPGLTQTSLLPQGAKAIGINFKTLINLIIQSAHA